MSKNFVDYNNATDLMNGVEDRIEKNYFEGTKEEWNALTDEQKAVYDKRAVHLKNGDNNPIDLSGYQKKTLDTPVASQTTVEGALGALDTNKANSATSLAGYGITDAYTKTQVDNSFQTKLTNPLTKSDVVNNLNTNTQNVPLSASMGKALQDRISTCKLLGQANTPTTARTAVTIPFNETTNNFALVFIKYGFAWGASHIVTFPTRVGLNVPFLPECGHGAGVEHNNIRIEMTSTNCTITTGDYDMGTSVSGAPADTIEVYGVIRING